MASQSDRLRRRLQAIPAAVRTAVQPTIVAAGNDLAGDMRRLAPVDTGALKASIHVTPPGGTTPLYSQPGGSRVAGELEALVTAGDSEVRYAHLVEFGTTEATAQPFFWVAVRLDRKRLTSRIKRAISKAVRKEWAR
jgi:HK97 gp10 family phage protein